MNRLATIASYLLEHPDSSWEEILVQFPDPVAQLSVVAYLAPMRRWDKELHERAFLPNWEEGDEGPSLERLLADKILEPVPYQQNVYTLADPPEPEQLKNAPRPFRSAARTLLIERLDPCGQPDGEANLDLLHLLAPQQVDEALRHFDSFFKRADSEHNMAACDNLLKVMELLPPVERHRLEPYRRQREVRRLTNVDYYETVRYLQRAHLKKKLDQFLADEKLWALELHATGGMGKTQLLRWLRGRHCVVMNANKPCARIDFDEELTRLAAFDWHPSSLLPRIVRQWDRFLEGQLTSLAGSLEREGKIENEEITNLFRSGTGYLENTLLLICDTTEEILLSYPEKAEALVKLMFLLHEANPKIKVIFSGRYYLEEKLDLNFSKVLKGMIHLEVTRFEAEEARQYLLEKQRLSKQMPLDAIVAKAEGNPMRLALLADYVRGHPPQGSPQEQARKIAEIEDVSYAYLVRRIINRIPHKGVQWLLRYGAIFHRLSKKVVQGVLETLVGLGLQNETADAPYDPANEKLIPEDLREEVWQRGAGVATEDLWEKLTPYVATSSWISSAADDHGLLILHGDLREPLRHMLRKYHRDVYDWLQRSAAFFFDGLANASSGEDAWCYRLETIRHQLYLDAEKHLSDWDSGLELAVYKHRPDWVERIGSLLKDTGAWSLLSHPIRTSAALRVAAFLARFTREIGSGQTALAQARRWIDLLNLSPEDLKQNREIYLLAQAEIALGANDPQQALVHLDALDLDQSKALKRVALLKGEAFLALSAFAESEAEINCFLEGHAQDPFSLTRAFEMLGDIGVCRQKWAKARSHFQSAVEGHQAEFRPNYEVRLRFKWALAARAIWQLAEARRVLFSEIETDHLSPETVLALLLERVRFHLQAMELDPGLILIEDALGLVADFRPGEDTPADWLLCAQVHQLAAEIYMRLARFGDAWLAHEQAISLLQNTGDRQVLYAGFLKFAHDSLKGDSSVQAKKALATAQKLRHNSHTAQGEVLSLKAEKLQSDDSSRLQDCIEAVCAEDATLYPPLALELLLVEWSRITQSAMPMDHPVMQKLLDGLRPVAPIEARLFHLSHLSEWCIYEGKAAEELNTLLNDHGKGDVAATALTLCQAEVARITGRPEEAREILIELERRHRDFPLRYWVILDALEQTGHDRWPDLTTPADFPHQEALAQAMFRHGQRLFVCGAFDRAGEHLGQALEREKALTKDQLNQARELMDRLHKQSITTRGSGFKIEGGIVGKGLSFGLEEPPPKPPQPQSSAKSGPKERLLLNISWEQGLRFQMLGQDIFLLSDLCGPLENLFDSGRPLDDSRNMEAILEPNAFEELCANIHKSVHPSSDLYITTRDEMLAQLPWESWFKREQTSAFDVYRCSPEQSEPRYPPGNIVYLFQSVQQNSHAKSMEYIAETLPRGAQAKAWQFTAIPPTYDYLTRILEKQEPPSLIWAMSRMVRKGTMGSGDVTWQSPENNRNMSASLLSKYLEVSTLIVLCDLWEDFRLGTEQALLQRAFAFILAESGFNVLGISVHSWDQESLLDLSEDLLGGMPLKQAYHRFQRRMNRKKEGSCFLYLNNPDYKLTPR